MFMLLYVFVLSHVPCSRMRVLGLLMCLLKPVLSYAAVELVLLCACSARRLVVYVGHLYDIIYGYYMNRLLLNTFC